MLAIAALMLGAEEAVGTDTDRLAVQSAACNAALNGMESRLRAVQCGASPEAPEPLAAAGVTDVDASFDVVVANILQVWPEPDRSSLWLLHITGTSAHNSHVRCP